VNKKKLIIPVEFQNRELKGACILASVFVKKGWDVYIGQKQQFFPLINMFSRAVWYVKSVVPGEQGLLQKLKNENHFIASYDVEGLMLNPHTKFGYKTRYSTKNIKLVDVLFFWGARQYKEFSKTFSPGKKSFIVGSNIFDANKVFKTKNVKIKNQILFISSFTTQNPINKKAEDEILDYTTGNKNRGELKKILTGWSNLTDKMFGDFLKFLLYSKGKIDPKLKIVIRPHPSENFKFWNDFKKKNSLNYRVENNKNLSEQILESKYVAQYLSTTSVLTNFLKRPCILYCKLKNWEIKKYFNEFSKKISINYKDASKFINDLNKNTIKIKDSSKYLETIVEGYSSKDNFYSSKKIYNIINREFDLDERGKNYDPFKNDMLCIYYNLKYNLKHKVGLFIANLYSFFNTKSLRFHHLTYRHKLDHKWADISSAAIKKKFKIINKKEFSKIKCIKHKNGFFKITRDNEINYN